MSLLEDLKKQAQRLQAEQHAEEEHAKQHLEEVRAELVPALATIHEYLRELVDQLTVVRPQIPFSFPLRGYALLAGLTQGGYTLSHTGDKPLESVRLSFTLSRDKDYHFDVQAPSDIGEWVSAMKDYGVKIDDVHVLEETSMGQKARITVGGQISVFLLFAIDYEHACIVLTVHNYDQLGEKSHRIAPEQVTSRFLDELAKYILRRDNRFLRQEVSMEFRNRLRRQLEHDEQKKKEELTGALEAFSSRIKSLFKRKAVLHLQVFDKTLTLRESEGGIMIGRAEDCALAIDAIHVSRHHARIEYREGAFHLIDQSRNGTFIRGEGDEDAYVHHGDVVLPAKGVISAGIQFKQGQRYLIRFSS